MWRLTRRDAISVWSNEIVKSRFSRYRAIIDLQLPARYLVARLTEVEIEPSPDFEALWRAHEDARPRFEKLLQESEGDLIDHLETFPETSFLHVKKELANKILHQCIFCERKCNVDRANKTGFCEVKDASYVSSAFLHTGEEAPLVPSGTIFFSGCNLRCAHCQNYDISCNPTNGQKVTETQLAAIADELASQGAKNINYVGGDPTPHIHTILSSLLHQQFNITQLWNSNMYLSNESMELLLDLMDFWLPDLKYFSEECAKRISEVPRYPQVVPENIRNAYNKGTKEMIIRVLVLPNHLECCVLPILDWISKNTPEALVNIMAQYRPLWKVTRDSKKYADLTRRVTREEMQKAYAHAESLGIEFRSVS